MSVRIRLQRHGAKKRPFYRVVAADQRAPRDGRFIELLGTYDPLQDPPAIRLKKDRVDYWLGVGASPSDTAQWLLKSLEEGKAIDLSAEGAEAASLEAKRAEKQARVASRKESIAKANKEAAEAAAAAEAEAKAAAAAEAKAAADAKAAEEAAAAEEAKAEESEESEGIVAAAKEVLESAVDAVKDAVASVTSSEDE